jgi:hypothetical protein
MDLLENYSELPQNIQDIIFSFNEDLDAYKECERIENELKPLGYSVEYGLDGTLFNLQKL